MSKVYADIPKFKRIEACLRETIVSYRKLNDEIEKSLESQKRTDAEQKLLLTIRKGCSDLQQQSRELLNKLYKGIEPAE